MSDSAAMVPKQLKITPGILRALVTGLTDDQMNWKPALDRFSIAEALAHLAHAERHAYQSKYDQFSKAEESVLQPYDTDGLVAGGEYSGHPAAASLAEFERLRQENLALLPGLED